MTVISLGEVWAQFQESALTEVTHAHVKRLSWVSRELLLVHDVLHVTWRYLNLQQKNVCEFFIVGLFCLV